MKHQFLKFVLLLSITTLLQCSSSHEITSESEEIIQKNDQRRRKTRTTNNNNNNDNNNVFIKPRIIGGYDSERGRFPYFVSLVDEERSHRCGGTLVAPDVVLTAAHCSGYLEYALVGLWNRDNDDDGSDGDADGNNNNNDYDTFGVLSNKEYIHPQYVDETLSYDFMLLKLDQESSKQYIILNENPDIPTGTRNNEVTALGFGTLRDDEEEYPSILQHVELTYISNEECETSADPYYEESYKGLITDVMMCASNYGQDSCQGDSGGPLLIDGGSPENDLLVGAVSWGFGCALPAFPGVYSRVSHQVEWMKQTICHISDNPPEEYDCSLYTPLPDGDKSVPVTLVLNLDDFPTETQWSIKSSGQDGQIYGQAVVGHYTKKRATIVETIFLPAGSVCIFEITDSNGDGLCCNSTPGNYVLLLGRATSGTVLAVGGGDFGSKATHEVEIPTDFDYQDDDKKPIVGEGQILLTLVMQLDGKPTETGWIMDRLGLEEEETVVRVPPGVYKTPLTKVIRTLVLCEDELYSFRLHDLGGDGIKDGYVQLFLGTDDIEDKRKMIFESDGAFERSINFSFISSFDTDSSIGTSKQLDSFITVEIQFDLYPHEIGFQLRVESTETAVSRNSNKPCDEEGMVIFFRAPGYYGAEYAAKKVTEIIPIPIRSGSSRVFTFAISDSRGDGLCCNWNGFGSNPPGYTLYEMGPGLGNVIHTSKMEATNREVTSFTMTGPTTGTLNPTEPLPTVDIRVTISLDGYPIETGFFIQDMSGNTIVDMPCGSFSTPNEILEEVFTLEIGVYTFTILDDFGNGLERKDSFYRIDIVGEENRAAVLAGSGKFVSQESKVFVLEGSTADFPLKVEFSTDDKPMEFSFFVQRLDLLAPPAYVADVPKGSYSLGNQDITELFPIRNGGLYQIVFNVEDGAKALVTVGAQLNSKTYSIDFIGESSWQLRFLAGDLPEQHSEAKTLDLHIQFDQFPQEFQWILLWNSNSAGEFGRMLQDQKVIGYSTEYTPELENQFHKETISLPPFNDKKSFAMILTDHGGDGVCCDFGQGGPVELYDGNVLLFTDPLQGVDRSYHSFTLEPSKAASTSFWRFTSGLVLSLTIMICR